MQEEGGRADESVVSPASCGYHASRREPTRRGRRRGPPIRPHPREDRKALVWKRWLHNLTRNPAEKLLSLVIAVALWFSVTQQLEFEQTLVFPIEYANRPAGLTPIDALPTEAKT